MKRAFFSKLCAVLLAFAWILTPAVGTVHAQTLTASKVASSQAALVPAYVPPEPDCYATGCDGQDPFQTNCGVNGEPLHSGNVVTYASVYIPSNSTGGVDGELGVIYNYYSSFCDANWSEVTMYQDPGRAVRIYITTTDSNGNAEKQCEPTNCSSSYTGSSYPAWTNMIDGTNVTTACAVVTNGAGPSCVSQ